MGCLLVSDMFFNFKLLAAASIISSFSVLRCLPALANSSYSECSAAATQLNLGVQLCDGQASNQKALKGTRDAESLRRLGVSLRRLGFLNTSQEVLDRSYEIEPTSIETQLSKANLTQAKYRRALASVDTGAESILNQDALDDALKYAKNGLSEYSELLRENPKSIDAGLNWITLWSNLRGATDLKKLQLQNLTSAQSIIKQVNIELSQNQSETNIESKLLLSESLLRAISLNKDYLSLAKANIDKALFNSYKINNLKLVSKAEGLLGQVHLLEAQENKALDAFLRAYSSSESIRDYNQGYKWAREIGKIYANQGNTDKAVEFYSISIDRLENIRAKIASSSTEIQYSFRENIEPIYKEYLELLFKNPQPDLNKIALVNEKLQVGELENYLRCNNLQINSLLKLNSNDSPDAALYFVRLKNTYAILIRNKTGQIQYRFLDKSKIDSLLLRLKLYVQGDSFLENTKTAFFGDVSSQLYDQIIKPIKNDLPAGGHLVLAVDSNLQSVPWGLLYDGQKYLIETYSLSVALGAEFQAPSSRQSATVTGLIAGASQFPSNPEFSPLPNVPQELKSVSSELKGKTLLDSKFTSETLLSNAANFDILHLASHGQFSSNPEETFLLDWNGKFKLSELQSLVKDRDASPLDLLVLSACDTAKGDRRALLGLAGTAVQSGARSTVASLWLVNDASQVMLIQEFYTQLLKNKNTKAESLRLAQLKLLKSDEFSSPYYWAGILLLGSWL